RQSRAPTAGPRPPETRPARVAQRSLSSASWRHPEEPPLITPGCRRRQPTSPDAGVAEQAAAPSLPGQNSRHTVTLISEKTCSERKLFRHFRDGSSVRADLRSRSRLLPGESFGDPSLRPDQPPAKPDEPSTFRAVLRLLPRGTFMTQMQLAFPLCSL